MRDYEQMYYDLLYKYKKIKKKNKQLEQEIEIYRLMGKNKDLKKLIVKFMMKYLERERFK